MEQDQIDDIILELALASALPVNIRGRNFVKAAAAANTLAFHTSKLAPKELKSLVFAIGPLLVLMGIDVDNPVTSKAALGLRSLIASRVCLAAFLERKGLEIMAKSLNTLMGHTIVDLINESIQRTLVVHCINMYRDIAAVRPWDVVNIGGLRHLVICLEHGDMDLKSVAAGTLAMCSKNLRIVEQMFAYGCIKPIINCADVDATNPACALTALGCIIQLCKVPDIGILVAKQGAIVKIEKNLLRRHGFSNVSIREKALYAIAWLSRIPQVKRLVAIPTLLAGLKHELTYGTPPSKYTILQIILNIHGNYDTEEAFVFSIRGIIIDLMEKGMWHARNLCVKAVILLYRSMEDKLYFCENGALDTIIDLVTSKSADLYEVPMVGLLSFMIHPDIPPIFMEKGGCKIVGDLLCVENEIVVDMSKVLLKVFGLYDPALVEASIPRHKKHLMEREDDLPIKYGGEFGGMIEQYLQRIVENRRDQHYLLEQLEPDDYDELGATDEELESYENTFMELDFNCAGELGIDEMKMLMVMMGEEFDEIELKEILERWDADGSGSLDFKEFVAMMQGWTTQFGSGMEKMYNEAMQRGAVGKARRDFNKWWNKAEIEKEQIEAIKAKKQATAEENQALAEQFFGHEKLRLQREAQEKANAAKRAGEDDDEWEESASEGEVSESEVDVAT
jgi:hypothetical protein